MRLFKLRLMLSCIGCIAQAVIAEPVRWTPYIPPPEYWQKVSYVAADQLCRFQPLSLSHPEWPCEEGVRLHR